MVGIRYLLDTDILSEPLKPVPNPGVLSRLKKHAAHLGIPAIVWHEARYGSYRLKPSPRRVAIAEYLSNVVATNIPILPYDAEAAAWHAKERARLDSIGRTPPFVDSQIAAIAAASSLVLVTRNVAIYRFFLGLRIENWYSEP